MSKSKIEIECSFCGKTQNQVKKLVAGNGVYICNECIEMCNEIIDDYFKENDYKSDDLINEILTPKKIKEYLDQHVIGQEDAKISLSVAV